MAELKEKKRELEAEKRLLNRKQMQAQWYNKKKSSASNSTPSTPLNFPDIPLYYTVITFHYTTSLVVTLYYTSSLVSHVSL